MSQIKRSALVHYSPAQMYQLVNDVDSYASFLPWCRSSKILECSATQMTASVEIAKGVLNKTFTTKNTLLQNQRIDLVLLDGPFKKLEGCWRFEPLKTADACNILLNLEFEFESMMVSISAKPIFTQIANSLVDSFCKRAQVIYGKPS